ncbi:efflux RND transporter periplasmic adaptor subunit [Agrobacterium sp. ES01]|uniref:efflux RND transporter periplasmic adaptor subunit n=1 Tax=Agrobacterium sp. ES01 TaxID=3420714 RepID=UPI003D0ADCB5
MKSGIVLPIVIMAAALSACSQEKAAEEPVRPVLSMIAEPREPTTFGFAGTVEAKFSTDLSFQVLGRIIARDVTVGDLVKKGQVLARLDPTALQLAVNQAEADLASAVAKLDFARTNEERQEKLFAAKASTKEQLEEAIQSREAAKASTEQLQASLSKAREQFGYAVLKAESDGVVSSVSAQVGEVVSAGETVMTIARLEARDAVVDIPDSYSKLTAIGMPYEVALEASSGTRVRGIVRETSPQSDAATRTRRTKIALEAAPASYRLGSTVTAFPVSPSDGHIWLPLSAVGGDQDEHFVWVVDMDAKTVEKRTVTIRPSATDGVDVLSGLTEGERVVTAGVHSLTENQPVKIPDETPL